MKRYTVLVVAIVMMCVMACGAVAPAVERVVEESHPVVSYPLDDISDSLEGHGFKFQSTSECSDGSCRCYAHPREDLFVCGFDDGSLGASIGIFDTDAEPVADVIIDIYGTDVLDGLTECLNDLIDLDSGSVYQRSVGAWTVSAYVDFENETIVQIIEPR